MMGELDFLSQLEDDDEQISEYAGTGDSVLGFENLFQSDADFDGEEIYGATSYAKWGNPDAVDYYKNYVVRVSFMRKSLAWHKWAVIPLMKVQDQLIAEGWDKKYNWSDLQTYCNRFIAGSRTKSNHSWPIAIDVNPSRNPMRYDNKLVTDIPYRIVEIFKRYGFKWGGEYVTVKDAMHFEYLGEPVREYSQKRELYLKSPMFSGNDVKELQTLLGYYGYSITSDGVFGRRTDAIVRSFQASKMLTVNGRADETVWNALISKSKDRILREGMSGKDVLWIQKVLKKIRYTNTILDGVFSFATKKNVVAFQKSVGLVADGIIGAKTWYMLRNKSN